MNTDPLYDKQTKWAIVLLLVAFSFICGAAIGSYDEPSNVHAPSEVPKNETESWIPDIPTDVGSGVLTPVSGGGVDNRSCYVTIGHGAIVPKIEKHNSFRLRQVFCGEIIQVIFTQPYVVHPDW